MIHVLGVTALDKSFVTKVLLQNLTIQIMENASVFFVHLAKLVMALIYNF